MGEPLTEKGPLLTVFVGFGLAEMSRGVRILEMWHEYGHLLSNGQPCRDTTERMESISGESVGPSVFGFSVVSLYDESCFHRQIVAVRMFYLKMSYLRRTCFSAGLIFILLCEQAHYSGCMLSY